jgi:hypothetical protein
MNKEFIDSLRELVNCHDLCNIAESPVNRELRMWREIFLNAYQAETPIEDEKIRSEVFMKFMTTACLNMMQMSPKDYMDKLIKETCEPKTDD